MKDLLLKVLVTVLLFFTVFYWVVSWNFAEPVREVEFEIFHYLDSPDSRLLEVGP